MDPTTSYRDFKRLIRLQPSEILWRDAPPLRLKKGRISCPEAERQPKLVGEKIYAFLQNDIALRLKERSSPATEDIVAKTAEQVLFNCGLQREDLHEGRNACKAFDAIDDTILTTGGLDLFEDSAPEEGKDARNCVKFLMSEGFSGKDCLSTRVVSALLMRKNEAFLQDVRGEFQLVLRQLYEKLHSGLSAGNERLAEMLIGNILSFLTLCEPEKGVALFVPQKIDGTWQYPAYTTRKIPLVQECEAPYPAHILEAQDISSGAPPLLLFMATPPPTVEGAVYAYWTDCAPFRCVGEHIYNECAKEILSETIGAAVAKHGQKMKLYGLSLGGSLALITASSHPNEVSEVHAYNGTGVSQETVDRYQKATETSSVVPDARNYWNDNDIIPMLGWGWHPDWKVIRLVGKSPQNPFYAHLRMFSAYKEVVALNVDVSQENMRPARRPLTWSLYLLAAPVFACTSALISIKQWAYHLKQRWQKKEVVCAASTDAAPGNS